MTCGFLESEALLAAVLRYIEITTAHQHVFLGDGTVWNWRLIDAIT